MHVLHVKSEATGEKKLHAANKRLTSPKYRGGRLGWC